MEDIIHSLKKKLTESVQRNAAPGLLFSGGVDSGILAALRPGIHAVTVTLKSLGEDLRHAQLLARNFGLKHLHKNIDVEEAIDAIPQVINILQTFDPAIPNDLAVYFGLKAAKEIGFNEVMTGDGGDELFGGYSYMQDIPDLKDYLKRLTRQMKFSSNTIGEFFKIKIRQPFLDRRFIDFSLTVDPCLKIKKQDGRVWGKWILRKAFEDILPPEITWQNKRPLESGSGMSGLREILSAKVSDEEFKENTYPVKFINKEHLYYYKVYQKVIGVIPGKKQGEDLCPGCGAGIRKGGAHCRVCGWVRPEEVTT